MASDGRWYPPEQAAGATPAPGTDPTQAMPVTGPVTEPPAGPPPGSGGGSKTGLIVAGVVVLVALVAAAVLLLGGDDGDDDDVVSSTTTTEAEPDDTTTTEPDDEGSTTTTEADDADVPDGFQLVEGDGISLAIPEDWVQIDASDAELTPEELAELDPGADAALLEQGLAAFRQGAVLVATDVSGEEFADNVNVLAAPAEIPVDVLESQGEQEIEAVGGEVQEVVQVELPAGEAVRMTYTLDGVAPDGTPFTVSGIQHYIPIDGRTYIITVSSDSDPSDIADPMAESFQVR